MPVIYPNSIPDPDFVLVPEGEYDVEVEKIDEIYTKNGDLMWKTIFRVVDGEYSRCKIFTNLVFTEKALGNIKVFCKAVGFDTKVDRLDLKLEEIEGATLRITVIHETYPPPPSPGGKVRAKIPYAGFMPLDVLEEKKVSDSPVQPAKENPKPEADEDIPF